MARTNGRCQMTSPIPDFTWMTALGVTLIAVQGSRYARCNAPESSKEPMRTDLFDFALPEDRIALRPASPRDSARLLVVRPGGALEDRTVRDLPALLRAATPSSSMTPRCCPPICMAAGSAAASTSPRSRQR